jgi:hypothetical protein
MDQLRAMAYLDLLNAITAGERIASAWAKAAADTKASTRAPAQPDPVQADPAPSGRDRPPAAGGCPFGGDCHECDGRCLPDDDDSPYDSDQGDGDAGAGGPGCACRECTGSCVPLPDEDDDEEHPNDSGPDDDQDPHGSGPDGSGPDDGSPSGGPDDDPRGGPSPSRSPDDHPEPRSLTDLVIPLLTLLGLAERPGEGHGLGPLDPALCRDLAAAASNSLRSRWCVTITDPSGFAVGHGCARLGRGDKATWKTWLSQPRTQEGSLAALPSQVNLTIPAAALPALAALARRGSPPGRDGPGAGTQPRGAWAFTPHGSTGMPGNGGPPGTSVLPVRGIPSGTGFPERTGGPPGTDGPPGTGSSSVTDTLSGTGFLTGTGGPPGTDSPSGTDASPGAGGQSGPRDGNVFGTWTLTLPCGRNLTVVIEPVPTYQCDHQRETHGYEPSDALRHLVQVRDGNCTFPPCSRHARETDFEHAIPYHKGGRTCACNASARSRKCHRIKQSPGWNVAQPRPGWHQWTTPSGRVYTQEPKRYPS